MDIRCGGLVDRRESLPAAERRLRRRHRVSGRWVPVDVRAIVLHQTAGIPFSGPISRRVEQTWEEALDDDHPRARRLYRIDAHFVVLQNGVIYYTRDVSEQRSGSAGRSFGIDIEFAGDFCHGETPEPGRRVPHDMLRAGRRLVAALVDQVGTITHIHPHGQVQTTESDGATCGGPGDPNPCGKLESCPGPDIWVNIGEWACQDRAAGGLGLTCAPVLPGIGFPDRAIVPAQRNPAYAVADL